MPNALLSCQPSPQYIAAGGPLSDPFSARRPLRAVVPSRVRSAFVPPCLRAFVPSLPLRAFVPSCLCAFLLSGCAGAWLAGEGGRLRIESQAEPGTSLSGGFDTGLYRYDSPNELTVLLFDGPAESPTQAVSIRMHWRPRAGGTPIDPNATNATIHYIILAGAEGAEAGVYSGAGYVYPRVKPGRKRFVAGLWQANLRLDVATDGFKDLLGQALLKGSFTARRDDLETGQMLRRLNGLLHQKLGYPRLVMAD